MAWSWSHSTEAYQNARENLEKQSIDFLRAVYAEWNAQANAENAYDDIGDSDEPGFDEQQYYQAYQEACEIPDDILCDFIWNKMEEQATCDNGGFNAWACPYGCHLISFSEENEDEE